MILTEQQNDALTELINIAFARTAASLSELTGYRVLLEVPQVAIDPIDELKDRMSSLMQGEIAAVRQLFSGQMAGDALLMLDYQGAVMLAGLLTDEQSHSTRLDESMREVLTEVGNILLNACLGMFGNLLHVHVSFSVPRLYLESLDDLLKTLVSNKEEMRYVLIVYTKFRLRDNAVSGYLMIVMGVSSLDQLLRAVEDWEPRTR